MNFLLIIFQGLVMCITYKITPGDYDSLRDLIVYSDEAHLNELYNEIISNPNFLCSFTLYKSLENYKEIKIENLINEEIETGYNKLPRIFCEISSLNFLILVNLNLYKLPSRFENLKELKNLNLAKNEFHEFPKVLFSLTQLKILRIDMNKINMIPSEIIKMTGLETLTISRSYNLENINVNLCKLKKLKELDLSFNKLLFSNENFIDCSVHSDCHMNTNNSYCDGNYSVHRDVETFSCLKNLRTHDNNLSLFPSYFQNFVNLEELDISANNFEKIPHEIHSFSNLKTLEINHNRIKIIIIDNHIFNNMLELYIRNNEIQQFSISDNALQSLVSLNLSINRIYKLDSSILKLKQLKYLIMSNNIFTEIERYHYTKDNPIYLSLNLKNISVLANIFYYNGIEKLIITCLEQFDGDIDIFDNVPPNSKIEYLDLSYCFLTEIPYGIFKLINLKIFIANHNQIVELKNVFGTSSSLKLLELIHNQLNNVHESIFDMPALQELMLYGNRIELLPARINNISNRSILIDLCRNPLLRQVDTDIQTPELITIDQVDQDILINIRYTRSIISNEFIIPGDINFDLNIKIFYENLNIPINERLNLDKIKLCMPFKPEKHIKTKNQIEFMLHSIFQQIKPYKEEEKLSFLMRRMDVYYFYEATSFQENTSSIDFQKRDSIINYFESIVMIISKMLPEKKEFVDDTLVRFLHGLNFNPYTTEDDVPCLDGQGEAFIEAYMRLKLGDDCSNAEHRIMEIISNFKIDIIKAITTGRGEKEEIEIFLNWKNELSEEFGLQKEINLYGNMSTIQELHDKKYIVEEFFNRFTYQAITAEINKFLRDKEFGFKLYNQLREYFTSIYEENLEMNNVFESIQDDTDPNEYIQLKNNGAHLLLKLMGYLC